MIVISDASPLINLAIIGYFNLLKELYGTIILPRAVFNELTVMGKGRPGDQEAREADWIIVEECDKLKMASELRKELDPGESEAIALAIHLNADLLLIDEKLGRIKAHALHLKTIGLLGVLMECKYRGLIPEVRPLMDRLREEANFRIGAELYEEVKRMVGE
ncbi:MAG: DUF3368 domain-containing protein [Phaeodactylibacter sp.]|nr:DUF3368 domain-containing protein [Phaeodactylibacter sp.]